MQLLLGLFFFSILLTTGSSIQCSYCFVINGYCSGGKQECPAGSDVCMTYSLQSKGDKQIHANFEACTTKKDCKKMEDLKGKPFLDMATIPDFPGEAIIKEVVCSKAPPSFAFFFSAFPGLLLMKLLF
ncbi:phospholipase A2 inhibitor subunit gamma B-like [Crotalus tigris]|uniref:phospholipase A2 inhibitor subunit gamma B-like n=1 Tax=Crotalus tigris TaxID=88082 RepID=UPI00192F5B58|nr:phospholipase A2 inhibitor subunit gamma B-like [Crotalus tigris]XP_039174690.1 phospholipase A2 inhibitor subunit gamma B-like [Crotalus tigris]XP_039174691.1 phospholipase A2 inhibitor subunit gamma B-like [Crotalus tigris]XP_039174692.1 phospholipase A2 inhibitor subunit gamma B-like [Crotalus tigris]